VPDLAGFPPGYRARPAALADAPRIRDLMAAQGQASIGSDDTTLEEAISYLTGPRTDLARDGLAVVDSHDQLVAWGSAFDSRESLGNIDVYVHPDTPQDVFEQIARPLIDHCVQRLADIARSRDRDSIDIDAGSYRGERIGHMYGTAGFHRVRVYLRMKVDLSSVADNQPTPPPGVRIRLIDPTTDDDMELARTLRNAVLDREFGHEPMTFEQFRDSWLTTAGYDPTAWWIADDDSGPVGILLGNDSHLEDDAGFVRTLGVVESARGRGIARALLLTAFAEYARRGRAHVMLAVDSENETGATQLYESVGMRPIVTYDSWLLTLALNVEGTATTLSRNASTSA
jgi:mycothiol synthase